MTDGEPCDSMERFTRDLFDAIRLQTAQVQQERNAVLYDTQGCPKFAAWSRTQADVLRTELAAIFQRDRLTPEEVTRVLAIGSEGASYGEAVV